MKHKLMQEKDISKEMGQMSEKERKERSKRLTQINGIFEEPENLLEYLKNIADTSSSRKARAWARKRIRIYERDNWKCVRCGTSSFLSIDHKIPVLMGGTDRNDNLQAMCVPCNSRKDSDKARWKQKYGKGVIINWL